MKTSPEELTGKQKAAVLMIMLGDEAASAIYRALPERDVQDITREIAGMESVAPAIGAQIVEEYYRLSKTQEYMMMGGEEFARKLLIRAFGELAAKDLLERVERVQEAKAGELDSLRKADPQQLAKFLEGEHPQTVALIVAHLDAKQAAALLTLLNGETRGDVVRRLAEMRQFSSDMAQKVSVILNKKLQSIVKTRQRGYAGFKAVAEVLNRMDMEMSKSVLEQVEMADPKVALAIRNVMFTFEDLLATPEGSIRELLTQLDKKTLGMALKGASEDLKNHVFKCMSTRAADMLKEDMDILGPVRSRDVALAQQEAVNVARTLEAQGKLTLKMEGDDEYVV